MRPRARRPLRRHRWRQRVQAPPQRPRARSSARPRRTKAPPPWCRNHSTKWYANSGLVKNKTNNIEIKESFQLAPGKTISIVRIGEKYVALAQFKDNVVKLAELTEEELILNREVEISDSSFKDVFSNIVKSRKKDTKSDKKL